MSLNQTWSGYLLASYALNIVIHANISSIPNISPLDKCPQKPVFHDDYDSAQNKYLNQTNQRPVHHYVPVSLLPNIRK